MYKDVLLITQGLNREGKFLKKLWTCFGEGIYNKII